MGWRIRKLEDSVGIYTWLSLRLGSAWFNQYAELCMSSPLTKSGSSLDEDSTSIQGYSCNFEDAVVNTVTHYAMVRDLFRICSKFGPLHITLTTYPCDATRTSSDPITFSTYG
jgi:hypothetical protein